MCPIIDVISDDTFEYMAGSDMTYGGFNWKLNFRWYPVPQREMERRKGDRTLPVRSVLPLFPKIPPKFPTFCCRIRGRIAGKGQIGACGEVGQTSSHPPEIQNYLIQNLLPGPAAFWLKLRCAWKLGKLIILMSSIHPGSPESLLRHRGIPIFQIPVLISLPSNGTGLKIN